MTPLGILGEDGRVQFGGYRRQLGTLLVSGPDGTRAIIAEIVIQGCVGYVLIPANGMNPAQCRSVCDSIVRALTGATAAPGRPAGSSAKPAPRRVLPAATLARRGREFFEDPTPFWFPPSAEDIEVGGVFDPRAVDTEGLHYELHAGAAVRAPAVNLRGGERP